MFARIARSERTDAFLTLVLAVLESLQRGRLRAVVRRIVFSETASVHAGKVVSVEAVSSIRAGRRSASVKTRSRGTEATNASIATITAEGFVAVGAVGFRRA